MTPHTLRRISSRSRGNRKVFVLTALGGALAMLGLFRLTQQMLPASTIESAIPAPLPLLVPLASAQPTLAVVSAEPLGQSEPSAAQASVAPTEAIVQVSPTTVVPEKSTPSPQAALVPSPPAAGLDARANMALAGLPAGATAWFQDLAGSTQVERNASAPVVAASVIKLPIALEALRQERAGTLSVSTSFTVRRSDVVGGTGILQGQVGRTLTLQQLIDTTITYSDNVGANLLLSAVGGMDAVNRTMSNLGYTSTKARRLLMDTQAEQRGIENTASAAEVGDMLAKAHRGQLVDEAVSKDVIRVLKLRGQQTDPVLDFMGRQLIPRPSLAHINGELAEVRNDAGIVDTGKRTYVLSIFIHGGNDTDSERAIADASAAIYRLELQS